MTYSIFSDIKSAAKAEGFKTVRKWICFYFAFGYRLADLHKHLEYYHHYYCTYHSFYTNVIRMCEEFYGENRIYQEALRRELYKRSGRFIFSDILNLVSRIKGILRKSSSSTDAFIQLEQYGFTRQQVFCMMRKLNRRRRTSKEGFLQKSAYDRWQEIVEKKGYGSFTEAYLDMRKRGLTVYAMAKRLGVNDIAFRYRVKKLNRTTKEKQKN